MTRTAFAPSDSRRHETVSWTVGRDGSHGDTNHNTGRRRRPQWRASDWRKSWPPTDALRLAAPDIAAALVEVDRHEIDILFTELSLADGEGISLICATRRRWPTSQAVVVAAHASLETSIEALRHRVADFVLKPISDLKIASALERARTSRNRQIDREQRTLPRPIAPWLAPRARCTRPTATAPKREFWAEIFAIGSSDWSSKRSINATATRPRRPRPWASAGGRSIASCKPCPAKRLGVIAQAAGGGPPLPQACGGRGSRPPPPLGHAACSAVRPSCRASCLTAARPPSKLQSVKSSLPPAGSRRLPAGRGSSPAIGLCRFARPPFFAHAARPSIPLKERHHERRFAQFAPPSRFHPTRLCRHDAGGRFCPGGAAGHRRNDHHRHQRDWKPAR